MYVLGNIRQILRFIACRVTPFLKTKLTNRVKTSYKVSAKYTYTRELNPFHSSLQLAFNVSRKYQAKFKGNVGRCLYILRNPKTCLKTSWGYRRVVHNSDPLNCLHVWLDIRAQTKRGVFFKNLRRKYPTRFSNYLHYLSKHFINATDPQFLNPK